MSDWSWRYEGYDPQEERLRETLCAVGNGYLVTRGAAPEATADGTHQPGTYAAGVYNRLASDVAGHRVENESLVNLPNWLALTFRIEGGEWFDLDAVEVLEHEQVLDLRRAVLTRRSRVRDGQGRTTSVTQRRLVHMRCHHVCALETTITPEDWSGRLQVRSALDGTVRNDGVERYRELADEHLQAVGTGAVGDDAVVLEVETNQSHVRVAMAARTRCRRGDEPLDVERRLVERAAWVAHDLELEVTAGSSVTVDKVVTVFTGHDHAMSEPVEQAIRWLGRVGDFASLLADHVVAWHHLWERFHAEMDGDGEVLPILRLHLLHLLQTVSPNTIDLDVGVPPRGLHGEAYRGHILWDEIFVLPLLNLRLPAVSRSLLRYRHRRLPEARHAAHLAGHVGAMFPWQSGSDGREENQQLHLNPVSGRWVPDATERQRHVGLAVAHNVWQYLQATDDREFLVSHGAELLLEVARFFASLATYDASRDRFVIRGVMGPDEFHTGYPGAETEGVDNNAYTNVMVVWVLLRAHEVLDLLPEQAHDELVDRLGLRTDELERWTEITDKMFVPFFDDGIMSQFEGYEDLEELDWERYRRRYGDIARLDRLLESEGDDVNRYQASKQADVLMLFYLLPAEELRSLLEGLGYELAPEAIPRTIDHYLARTSHGSTLSAVVHAWVLARANRDRAVELFREALVADVHDIQGGTTAEGIHLAAMCGSVDLLQRCFAGLATRDGRLVLDPYWPEALGCLEMRLFYREQPLTLRVTGTGVRVTAGAGGQRPIEVACRDEVAVLVPGASVDLPVGQT